MSMCCGASMIGVLGTMKHYRTYIHHVPILHCPVCHTIKVHPKVQAEYDILAEFAHDDQAPEVHFSDYIDIQEINEWFSDCIAAHELSTEEVLRLQIDHSLDLLAVAKQFHDQTWMQELRHRLHVLSKRWNRLRMEQKEI